MGVEGRREGRKEGGEERRKGEKGRRERERKMEGKKKEEKGVTIFMGHTWPAASCTKEKN